MKQLLTILLAALCCGRASAQISRQRTFEILDSICIGMDLKANSISLHKTINDSQLSKIAIEKAVYDQTINSLINTFYDEFFSKWSEKQLIAIAKKHLTMKGPLNSPAGKVLLSEHTRFCILFGDKIDIEKYFKVRDPEYIAMAEEYYTIGDNVNLTSALSQMYGIESNDNLTKSIKYAQWIAPLVKMQLSVPDDTKEYNDRQTADEDTKLLKKVFNNLLNAISTDTIAALAKKYTKAELALYAERSRKK